MFTLFSQSRLSESMLTLKMWYVIPLLWFFSIKHYLKKEKPLLCSFIFLSHFRLSQNRFMVWRSVLAVVLHFWVNALLRFRESCLRYAMLVASTRRGLFAHARVFLHIINNRCLMIPLLPMSVEKVPMPMTRGTSFNDCKIVPHVFIAFKYISLAYTTTNFKSKFLGFDFSAASLRWLSIYPLLYFKPKDTSAQRRAAWTKSR